MAPTSREVGLRRVRRLGPGLVAGLLLLALAVQLGGYVNELGGDDPDRYLSDSNLDWGQDAWRLRDWWQARGRPPLSLAYFGTLSLDHYGITGTDVFPGREPVHGLLAVSVTRLTVIGDDTHFPYAGVPYRDLQQRTPVARIGTSIVVYQLD